MSKASIYALATLLFFGAVATAVQIPSATSQAAAVALFGDSLSRNMSLYAPGVLQGTFFTSTGSNTTGFNVSNAGKSTSHFVQAASQALQSPSYNVVDFFLGGNNPSTAGRDYATLANLAVQNNKTLVLPVYGHVGIGSDGTRYDTRASDAAARALAQKYPNNVKVIDYQNVPCFRNLNGGDPHPGRACARQMAEYRQQQLQNADANACLKKTDITVGFRGIPGGCPGDNPSDGVDIAVNNAGGKVFTYQQGAQALAYIKQQVGSNSDATITIVGHSAGAETAIKLAQQLESSNIKVTRLVAADPGSSRSAIPANIVQAVGLFSTSGKYNGGTLSGKSPVITIQKNVGHCELDNLIEKAIPCVKCNGNKCEYTGSSVCTTDSSGKETCTVDPNLPGAQTQSVTAPAQQTLPQRLQNLARTLTGQKPATPTTNNQGTSNNANTSSQCPSGYSQSIQNGRIICTKQEASDAKPQCLLVGSSDSVSSGEQLILRWRTAGATRVDITDVGENVSENGQKTLVPSTSTTYTLTATNSKGTKQTCDFLVTVLDPSSKSSGAASPKLSCAPSLIKKGTRSSVRWECPSQTDGSKGMGVDTNGRKSGTIQVTPEYNKEYAVACLDDDGTEVGKNSCSVSIGDPQFDIVVHPKYAGRGDRIRVAWASLFADNCRVIGPRGFDYAHTQGVVITEPFAIDGNTIDSRAIRSAVYTLTCDTAFGDRVTRDIEVGFRE